MLFVSLALPFLEEVTALLLTWMEVVKGIATLKITKLNKEIHDITYEDNEPKTNPIGFIVPQEANDEEEEY